MQHCYANFENLQVSSGMIKITFLEFYKEREREWILIHFEEQHSSVLGVNLSLVAGRAFCG